jgi:hypothetical protein
MSEFSWNQDYKHRGGKIVSLFKALISGFAGACAVTIINETARQFIKDAPRLDVLGKRAIAFPMMKANLEPPPNRELYWITLASDIASNTLYYSLVGLGNEKNAFRNGMFLGAAAGIGATALSEPLGLGNEPVNRTPQTELMTVGWYLAGGLAAAVVYQSLSNGKY